jgi:hypothetical protein
MAMGKLSNYQLQDGSRSMQLVNFRIHIHESLEMNSPQYCHVGGIVTSLKVVGSILDEVIGFFN